MSTPGDQPNPYAQQPANPYGNVPPPQPGPPGGQPAPSPYAYPPTGPQPGQPGAAAQPTMPAGVPVGQPGGPYGGQVPAGYGPGAPAPGVPAPGGPGSGGKTRGPLWALGGVVVASAVWAGVSFATGAFDGDPKAELGSYAYTGNLCGSSDFDPIKKKGFKEKSSSSTSKNPIASGTEDAALDTMQCNINFEADGASSSDYSSTWLTNSALLHHKTDPAPEFEAQYRAYENQRGSSYTYKVTEVPDLGDEAYAVTQVQKDGDDDGSYVILGVRDGWMTYQMSWSNYISSSSSVTPPDSKEVTEMLSTSAKATMARLQGQESDTKPE
ncbi:hypothetical protein [Streptomyces sp. NPDC057702]|uniref:hypothetical protein n=1 Tax=unclassified Streptomyces TaxID=2593676 RepID=UPI0036A9A346